MKRLLRLCILGAMAIGYAVNSSAADGDKFKLVSDASELKDGDVVIIAKTLDDGRSFAMSTNFSTESSHLLLGTSINIADGVAIANGETEEIELEYNKSKKVYYLKSLLKESGKYYGSISNTGNAFKYCAKSDNLVGKVTISFSDNNAKLDFKIGTSNIKSIQYRRDVTEEDKGRFGWYNADFYDTNKNYSVNLYKKISDQFTISEESTDASAITENLDKSLDVTLERTLVAGKWNTFCVPFDIDVAGGKLNGVAARVMQFESVEGNIMCFLKADKIEAGKPYLIKPAADIDNPTFADVKIQQAEPKEEGSGDYSFFGVYCRKTFDAAESKKSLFINGDAEFKRPSANSSMKGMRAYFACATEQAASSQLKIGDETTSVSEIVSDVDENGYIYNANGVRVGTDVNGLSKGLYIKNGRKFVIK